jgi:hypothetical protein
MDRTLNIPKATATTDGYLTRQDWDRLNKLELFLQTGVSGTFTTVDGKTVTVVNGLIISIV